MAFIDHSHQLADVQFTAPPAFVALYQDRPTKNSSRIGSVSKHDNLSNVCFFIRDETFGQYAFGFARVTTISESPSFQYAIESANSDHSKAWKLNLFDINASTDVDVLSETVESVFDTLSEFGPTSIDLNNISAARVQGEHLAAILRATAAWQDQTPGWTKAVRVAELALLNEGIDPQDALYGLI